MIHSILIIGQSNMAGRGNGDSVGKIKNIDRRIKVLRNGRWFDIYRPVNPDRKTAGVSLAESFAYRYAEEHADCEVGIIPCADGGTSLNKWREGGLLFDNAVLTTRLALRTSNLVAILWHQGEADCGEEQYPHYLEKITKIMDALRRELGAYDIPLIVGGLGDFLAMRECSPALKNYIHVNEALKQFSKNTNRCAYVSAEGLTSNSDKLHFNAASLLEFGERYYEEFLKIENRELKLEEKPDMDNAIRDDMENL